MDRTAAEKRNNLIAELLQLQALLHEIWMIFSHLDGPRISKKIRSMKHEDVKCVAFDPLAAIDQAPKFADWLHDSYAERVLHRMHSAHLVGDGTDSADSSSDVGRLQV